MRILIADDEVAARQRLQQLLADIPEAEVVGEAANGNEVLEQVQPLEPDVVLLDVRMPGMDGIEAATQLASLAHPPAVIFVTAYSDHALEAFAAQAVGYLLKPVRQSTLAYALHNASRVTKAQLMQLPRPDKSRRSHICARVRGGLQLVPVDEVLYFRAEHKYVTVRHLGGEVLIEDSLKQLETEFGERFLRIHRNALAAVEYIDGLEREGQSAFLRLQESKERLDISRRHLPRVRRLLRQHSNGGELR
ncbi:MAG: LytTR family DNA-binding domain-containing protein [Pseudomonadota bacterium]|nr:LytTR family DNA-binding domain-containing protein [Pseudomonadota bacterium]HJO36354.1 LytTR family DNA-binding domain-containing protein [Gammaproteobacteria bacterium]